MTLRWQCMIDIVMMHAHKSHRVHINVKENHTVVDIPITRDAFHCRYAEVGTTPVQVGEGNTQFIHEV